MCPCISCASLLQHVSGLNFQDALYVDMYSFSGILVMYIACFCNITIKIMSSFSLMACTILRFLLVPVQKQMQSLTSIVTYVLSYTAINVCILTFMRTFAKGCFYQ